jgi:glycosyltransferase involved in cell wall biosynthesis
VVTGNDKNGHKLRDMGVALETVQFNRGGLAPTSDLTAYLQLVSIYKRYKPTLIHHFHANPVIFGSIAARFSLSHSVRIVNTITGLGHAFTANAFTSTLAGLGYSVALSDDTSTIFQNPDDRELFLNNRWSTWENSRLIVGSGIDIDYFSSHSRERQTSRAPVVLMLGRLLAQKGVQEFIKVAHRIKREWPNVRFLWAGEEDRGHVDGISASWIRNQSNIEYLGQLSDVREILLDADVFIFPSFYREGVPRAIMEAAASGLPTVAFDVPGVREAVSDGETGYLVPNRDSEAMATRILELLEDEKKRVAMGDAARALAERAFDRRAIEDQHLAVYRDLGVRI